MIVADQWLPSFVLPVIERLAQLTLERNDERIRFGLINDLAPSINIQLQSSQDFLESLQLLDRKDDSDNCCSQVTSLLTQAVAAFGAKRQRKRVPNRILYFALDDELRFNETIDEIQLEAESVKNTTVARIATIALDLNENETIRAKSEAVTPEGRLVFSLRRNEFKRRWQRIVENAFDRNFC